MRAAYRFVLFILVARLSALSSPAAALVPDPARSHAECAYSGPEVPTVMVMPDATGPWLSMACLPDGAVVDATISMWLLDANGDPVPRYPHEDLWIESLDGGLARCPGGTAANADTDRDGFTLFRYPFRAGGYSDGDCQVFISGEPLLGTPLRLNFNSPDIDGSGKVDLADLGYFASDYHSVFHFRSDFRRDSDIDLGDLGKFVWAMGRACP